MGPKPNQNQSPKNGPFSGSNNPLPATTAHPPAGDADGPTIAPPRQPLPSWGSLPSGDRTLHGFTEQAVSRHPPQQARNELLADGQGHFIVTDGHGHTIRPDRAHPGHFVIDRGGQRPTHEHFVGDAVVTDLSHPGKLVVTGTDGHVNFTHQDSRGVEVTDQVRVTDAKKHPVITAIHDGQGHLKSTGLHIGHDSTGKDHLLDATNRHEVHMTREGHLTVRTVAGHPIDPTQGHLFPAEPTDPSGTPPIQSVQPPKGSMLNSIAPDHQLGDTIDTGPDTTTAQDPQTGISAGTDFLTIPPGIQHAGHTTNETTGIDFVTHHDTAPSHLDNVDSSNHPSTHYTELPMHGDQLHASAAMDPRVDHSAGVVDHPTSVTAHG